MMKISKIPVWVPVALYFNSAILLGWLTFGFVDPVDRGFFDHVSETWPIPVFICCLLTFWGWFLEWIFMSAGRER